MAGYSLSALAELDLADIFEYGILTFGIDQAEKYLNGIENSFEALARNSNLGRSAYELYPQLRQLRYESHIIFYLPKAPGIFVVRYYISTWMWSGICEHGSAACSGIFVRMIRMYLLGTCR